jgi:hypothetical protein
MLMAFFGAGELKGDAPGLDRVVEVFKEAAAPHGLRVDYPAHAAYLRQLFPA